MLCLCNMTIRSQVIVAGLVIALLPWATGGREPIGYLISSFGLLVSSMLLVGRSTFKDTWLWGLTTSLVVWATVSLLWSVNRYESLLWIFYLGLGLAAYQVAKRLSLAEKCLLIRLLVLASVGFALYGVGLFAADSYERLTSSFYWANPASLYFSVMTLLAIAVYRQSQRWPWLVAVVVNTSALMLTYSRVGILLAGLVIFTAWIIRRPGRQDIHVAIGALLLSSTLALGAIGLRTLSYAQVIAPGERTGEVISNDSSSGSDRLYFMSSAAEIFKDNPLAGTGAGTYPTIHPKYQERVISAATNAHNTYLQVFSELGLIGGVLLLALAAYAAFRVFRERSLGLLPALAGVACVVHFGLEIDSRYPSLIILVFVLVALSLREKHKQLPRFKYSAVAAALVVAVVASVVYTAESASLRAREFAEVKEYDRAVTIYGDSLRWGIAANPDWHTARGISYLSQGTLLGVNRAQIVRARDDADKAIDRDAHDSQHYILRAKANLLLGDNTRATIDYQRALEFDPYNHPEHYVDYVGLLIQANNLREAEVMLRNALSLYSDEVAQNRSARDDFRVAVAQLHNLEGQRKLVVGDPQGAQDQFGNALRLDPNNTTASKLLKAAENTTRP